MSTYNDKDKEKNPPSPNPMKQVQTPVPPTKEIKDDGKKGGSGNGKR